MVDPKDARQNSAPDKNRAEEVNRGAHQTEQDRRFGQPHHGHHGQHEVRLAKDWVQPRRRFNHDADYSSLPRFMPDYGRVDPRAHWKRS